MHYGTMALPGGPGVSGVPLVPLVPGVYVTCINNQRKTAKIRNISKVSGAIYISDVVFLLKESRNQN